MNDTITTRRLDEILARHQALRLSRRAALSLLAGAGLDFDHRGPVGDGRLEHVAAPDDPPIPGGVVQCLDDNRLRDREGVAGRAVQLKPSLE